MKLRHVLPLVLVCVFLISACEQQGSTFAVADLQRVMRDCDAGKQGVERLNAIAKEAEDKLKPLQEELEKKPEDADLQAKLQQVYAPLQQRMQLEQQNVINQLQDGILRVVNKYREQKGYVAILPSEVAFSFDPKLDVTNDLIAAANSEKIELKPLPEPKEPVAAPAAPAAEAGKDAPKADADKKDDTKPADTKDETKK